MLQESKKQAQNMQPRPPVVVVLGHVDHGKSSILEAIKDFKITAKESGGITQHIGAYEVEYPSTSSGQAPSTSSGQAPSTSSGQVQGKKITFIDTPGHEAFSLMRSRGANVADIAILVVAADEGVKTQTKEAIEHIKKSGLPLIIALNKMDKPDVDPEMVKRELSQQGIIVESAGGKVPVVETSAKTKKGIPELLEIILLLAEMEGLRGNPEQPGEGLVVETYLDSRRGPTATLLLRNGCLRTQDIVATSSALGKVRSLEDFQGKALEKALPSQPVIVLGFEQAPAVGEGFRVFPDYEAARAQISAARKKEKERKGQVFAIKPGEKVLNLILKADVFGSLEAISQVLRNLTQEGVVIRILKEEVGEINESDIKLAQSSKGRILGFRVKADPVATKLIERQRFKVMNFDVIYELIQKVREMAEKAAEPENVRVDLGKLKILALFRAEKNRQIVGGRIIEGQVKKGTKIEIFHGEEKIGSGKLVGLQKNKKDIEEAGKNEEVGILYEGEGRIEKGDVLVFYTHVSPHSTR